MVKKHGKKYLTAKKLIEANKKYEITQAVELIKKISTTKFVGSVELHAVTSADPKYNEQVVRGTVMLPHGIGKKVKIAAFVSDEKTEEAKQAGAEFVGNNELLKDIEEGKIMFDVLVTTPDAMRDLAKVAKILGPKGLMPSPKSGTVTTNLVETINEIQKGRLEYKIDKNGNLHIPVGKINFENTQLEENIKFLIKYLEDNKPSAVKGKLIQKVVLAPTMGPGIEIVY